jgi:hypothetical protein
MIYIWKFQAGIGTGVPNAEKGRFS